MTIPPPHTTLYVSDLDGTLLAPDSRISPRARQMLNQAIDLGAHFTIATARTPATVDPILQGINMTLPAIVMTGAAMWDTRSHLYSHIRTIPQHTVRDMMQLYRDLQIPTFVYRLPQSIIEIYHYGTLSPLETTFIKERIDNPLKHFETIHCCPDGMPLDTSDVALFYGMMPDHKALPLYHQLKLMPVTPLCYHDIFGPETSIVEVFGPNTSKANALRTLAHSIGADRIVAFGDNINDIPMLQVADLAVAVENAVPQVKQHAHITIGPNTDDAVAQFILQDISNHLQP